MDAERIAAATPGTRDRVVDLVRVGSLLTVVLGHWLMADVVVTHRGVRATNVLSSLPHLQLLTWALQPVPLLFVTGGFANLVVWRRARSAGGGYAAYVATRLDRLGRPALVFVLVWQVLLAVLLALGLPRHEVDLVGHVLGQPLWFLGVYVAVTALAPVMLRLHARMPAGALLGLVSCVVAVDVSRYAGGLEEAGYVNVALVWLFAQQVGFGYAEGRWAAVPRSRLVAIAVGALGALVVLTRWGPYPVSMVGLPGQVSNMMPPSACLLVLTVGQVAVIQLARPRLAGWLAAPAPWSRVATVGSAGLTIYLWHLTALVAAFSLVRTLGIHLPPTGSVWLWVTRPVWVALLGCALALVVVPLSHLARLRRPTARRAPGGRWPVARPALGAGLVSLGLLGFVVSGLAPGAPWSSSLLGLPVDPMQSSVCLFAGLSLAAPRWPEHVDEPRFAPAREGPR